MPPVITLSAALWMSAVMVMSPEPTLLSSVTFAVIASMSPETVMPGHGTPARSAFSVFFSSTVFSAAVL